jgi:hypothetical protein
MPDSSDNSGKKIDDYPNNNDFHTREIRVNYLFKIVSKLNEQESLQSLPLDLHFSAIQITLNSTFFVSFGGISQEQNTALDISVLS